MYIWKISIYRVKKKEMYNANICFDIIVEQFYVLPNII